jgi:hypothetical protein
MKERVKVFTHLSGHGTTVLEPPLEDHINQWLRAANGKLVDVSQSESERPGVGQHLTVCLWYLPQENEDISTEAVGRKSTTA